MKNISDIDPDTITTLRHYFSGQPIVEAWLKKRQKNLQPLPSYILV